MTGTGQGDAGTDRDPIGPGFVPRPRGTVAWEVLDGEAVLYEEDSGTVHLLDELGTIVWRCFDGESDLAGVVDDLAAAFEVDRDRVESDVLALAADLEQRGLLAGVEPEPGQGGPS